MIRKQECESQRERQSRIDAIFLEAVSLPHSERSAFLDHHCASESESFRVDVEQLLRADGILQQEDCQFLNPPPLNVKVFTTDGAPGESMLGRRIGPYQITKRVGEGGFSDVYLAHRAQPFEQDVAIKVIRGRAAGQDDIVRRFEMERQVMADLDHENIATLLDGGCTDDGRPYFVMEYVDGSPVTDYCDAVSLGIAERLRLFQAICRAVAYAHSRGVIHRDLKPRNILVTGDGVPKLLDFGIAKLTGPASRQRAVTTARMGLLPLTPEYASPEQVRGEAVTVESDVYSLGVVLYELLTGCRPYSLKGLSATEMEVTICKKEPPVPSSVVGRVNRGGWGQDSPDGEPHASSPETTPALSTSLRRTLSGDLDTIVLKALHKEAGRRYASPEQLAEDIDRYFDGRPVRARPDSRFYHLRKAMVRNRWAVAAICLIFLSLVGGLITRDGALREARIQEKLAQEQSTRSQRAVYNLQLARVSHLWQCEPRRTLAMLEDVSFCPVHLREFTWGLYRDLCQPVRMTLAGHTDDVHSVAYSPTDEILASAGKDGTIKLWDAISGDELATLAGHGDWINGLAFSPDGKQLASASRDTTIKLWGVSDRKEMRTLSGHTESVNAVAYSPHRRIIASAGSDMAIKLWDRDSGEVLEVAMDRHNADVVSLAFSPDGIAIASGATDGVVSIWDTNTGSQNTTFVTHRSKEPTWSLAFSPDGDTLATAIGRDTGVVLWDLKSPSSAEIPWTTRRGHVREIRSLAFSPDGATLATASNDTSVRLWDVQSGREKARLDDHRRIVRSVAFSRDGRRVATASHDDTVKVWDVRGSLARTTFGGHVGPIYGAAFSPDGASLISAGDDRTIRLWDIGTRKSVWTVTAHQDAVRAVAYSPRGNIIATGSWDKTIKLWHARTGKEIATLNGSAGRVYAVDFSPDGSILVSGHRDGTAILWDVETADEVARFVGHRSRVAAVCFSPDGLRLATGSRDGSVRLWDVKAGETVAVIEGNRPVGSVAFSPDGALLATGAARRSAGGTCEGTIRLWDMQTLAERVSCHGHADEVFCVAFSLCGETLVSTSADQTVRLCDTQTGQERASLEDHQSWVHAARFTPDGRTLATTGEDIKLWYSDMMPSADAPAEAGETVVISNQPVRKDAEVDQEPKMLQKRLALQGHLHNATCIAVSPDNTTIVSGSLDENTIILWDACNGTKRHAIERHSGLLVSVVFSPDGSLLASTSINGSLRVWDVADSRSNRVLRDDRFGFIALAFSPDGALLASTTGHTRMGIIVWDVRRSAIVKALNRAVPDYPARAIAFSPDGRSLACGTVLGRVRMWSSGTWREEPSLGRHFLPVTCLAFSSDGQLEATGSRDLDQPIIVWDRYNRRRLATLRGHTDWITSIAFSRDGKRLVSAAKRFDGTIRLWDVGSGLEIASFVPCPGEDALVAWSSDGRFLVSNGPDSTVVVWDVDAEMLERWNWRAVKVPAEIVGAVPLRDHR